MTYRNDLDALAAREAALTKELEAKAKERDEVGALLAEARAKEDATSEARWMAANARRRRWKSGYIATALLVPGVLAYGVFATTDRSPPPLTPELEMPTKSHVYSCGEIRPDYDRANALTAQAYAAALADKGLAPANLEEVTLGGGWSGGPMTREDLDKPLGVSPEPWTVIDYKHHGAKRRVLVGDVVSADSMYGAEPIELVADAHGGIFKVVRAPRVRNVKSVDVDACPGWGCFGQPPPGAEPPPILSRTLWLLPAGATYRGTIEISYDAPQILMNNIKNDAMGECSPPA